MDDLFNWILSDESEIPKDFRKDTVEAIKKQGLTIKSLQGLSDSDWKELIPPMGPRAIVRAHLPPAPGAAGGGGGQALTLLSLIERIYQSQPTWKNVMEVPEVPKVSLEFPFVGRESELSQLINSAKQNIKAFQKQERAPQSYRCPVVHGGFGIGKSRVGYEFAQTLPSIIPAAGVPGAIANIFLELFAADVIKQYELLHHNVASVLLGIRIAIHFFFGIGLSKFRDTVNLSSQEIELFTLTNVMGLIRELFNRTTQGNDKIPIYISIQFDEFSSTDQACLHDMIKQLSDYMSTEHSLGICIIPMLTGTNTTLGEESVLLSQLGYTSILLSPLTATQMLEIINGTQEASQSDSLLCQLLQQCGKLVNISVHDLGGVPRFLQIFVDVVSGWELPFEADHHKMFSLFFKHVLDRIKNKLNGITINKARTTGILILGGPDDLFKYQIITPMVLIRVINQHVMAIDDEHLDFTKLVDDRAFQRVCDSIRALRQNLLVGLGKQSATIRELYPHAIAFKDTLDMVVPISRLSIVQAKGSSSSHDSVHLMDPLCISIIGSDTTIDITKSSYIVSNVPMAPSFDSILSSPSPTPNEPPHLELIQYKSSLAVSIGEAPSTLLDIGTLNGVEYRKVTDTAHKVFYKKTKSTLQIFVAVSNKHLVNYNEILYAVDNGFEEFTIETTQSTPTGGQYSSQVHRKFLKNMVLVADNNFRDYASYFAHTGLIGEIQHQ
ncbi:hypothetical protein SAMD00019534_020560 [Acytostelium subglobosum LB1]|uniref:hypothetical protein n=1 Tax=Acytostelium subglobosum LB1 TaxID=1410327 RepID=UPI00064512EC|nr:hypothetical protein SAMD00019534_020560 [Acytostelium subglobosum LB1]GAM18881.1 hypothetical protein SAMD00019534_020560 [Acytostelium subglobosum LB1]|eukprot:XP_012758101.1 hypothetical protein SAMD00019534_020560 [Acytostelium subglobosum LB1]